MGFIPEREIELNQQFTSNPISNIVHGALMVRDMPLKARVEFLAELIQKLDRLHDQGEETFGRNTFMGIGSSFAMAAAVATSSALNPLAGMLLSGAAVLSWGGSMYEIFNENTKLEPVKDKLQRLSLALKSDETRKWAALWSFCGDEVFVAALEEASAGHVSGGKLIRLDRDTPIQKAIDIISRYKGMSYDDVVVSVRGILDGRQPQVASAPQYQIPTPAPQVELAPQQKIVEALPIQDSPPVYATTKIQEPTTVLQQYSSGSLDLNTKDIVDFILACVNSLAFIGGQRCGKSLLMAISSRIGVNNGKFNTVFVISSLAKKGEDDHYWAHCKVQTFYDLAVIVDKTPYYQEFLNTIRQFKKTTNADNPQLLIIDEFPYLCERLEDDIKDKNEVAIELMKEIANIGSVVASGGAKRGWYVWLGSPKGAIGEMGRGGKVMKSFSLCFCAVAPGATVDSNGVHVNWDSNLFSATKLNFPGLKEPTSGVAEDLSDRIIFFNGKWYAKSSNELSDIPVPQSPPKAITPAAVVTEDALMPKEREQLGSRIATTQKKQQSQAEMLIERIEQSQSATLEGFIIRELKCADKLDEMMAVIPVMLEKMGRSDLLGKFQ